MCNIEMFFLVERLRVYTKTLDRWPYRMTNTVWR